jgi:hypothetical protein
MSPSPSAEVAAGTFTFEPLTAQDLPLLHACVRRSHVAERWASPTALQEIEQEYPLVRGQARAGGRTRRTLACADLISSSLMRICSAEDWDGPCLARLSVGCLVNHLEWTNGNVIACRIAI